MKYIKYSIFLTIIVSIIFSCLFFYVLWRFSPTLPSYDTILNYNPNLSSRVYTSDGVLLKSFYKEERIYTPIDRIPIKIKEAFISAEDKNFYEHSGIDIFAIFRASIKNILNFSSDKRVVGASTITQQVVKNILLTNEVTFERKIKEILLSIRIENTLSKDKILELYLNDIYLGYGSYGIGTASLNYFNKSVYDLELDEIAFLAALPKAPNNYNPKTKLEKAIERRNWVLERMFKNGFINEKDLNYKKKPIIIKNRKLDYYIKADYFYEEIRKDLFKDYGEKKLYSDGLIIKTSLNADIQKFVDESLIEGLQFYDKSNGWRGPIISYNNKANFFNQKEKLEKYNPFLNSWKLVFITKVNEYSLLSIDLNKKKYRIDLNLNPNSWLSKKNFKKGDVILIEIKANNPIIRQVPEVNGAIIVMNPHNGQILGLSGGYSFGLSQFNRATQAKRQPGSAFKPFVYLTALEEGYTPSTLILDAPYVIDQGPNLPKWKPANYTDEFYGLTTMRTGIEKSRNLMTVRLADKIGMEKIIRLVNNFGINDGINNNLSMSLGSGLVTLIDITNAYAIIANGGIEIKPSLIKSIYNKHGKKIYISENKYCTNCTLKDLTNINTIPTIVKNSKSIIDPKLTYQITSMMEGVIQRGTAKKLKLLDVPIAGKTGTTNDNKDAWFIGFTPDLVIGVYVGYDIPKTLGYKQTGSSVAVPIFNNLAKKIKINQKKIPFRVPSGISFVKIDSKTGEPSNSEEAILEPYIIGTEPYIKGINIINTIDNIKNNSISGTGGLLEN